MHVVHERFSTIQSLVELSGTWFYLRFAAIAHNLEMTHRDSAAIACWVHCFAANDRSPIISSQGIP
jgi:hypothetical protein